MTNIQFSSDDPYRDNSSVSARSTTDDQKSEGNVLESLKKLIQDKVRRGDVHIPIPERPGVMIRVSPNISQTNSNHGVGTLAKNAKTEWTLCAVR